MEGSGHGILCGPVGSDWIPGRVQAVWEDVFDMLENEYLKHFIALQAVF